MAPLGKIFGDLIVLLPLVLPYVNGYWMFGSNPLVTTRLDPIINPGVVSSHVHSIIGGSRFSPTYNFEDLTQSLCSTGAVQQDLSNYWAPQLYYYDQNQGTYTPISAFFDIYYFSRPGPKNEYINAFPTGLRMVAGSPLRRVNNASNFADQAVSYECLDYSGNIWPEQADFYQNQCPDGLTAQIFFPSCWDGVNLDSEDHQSHMAYPIQSYDSGDCPETHPVHLASILYQVIFAVDFQDGWINKTVLQDALDNCAGDNTVPLSDCPPLSASVNEAVAGACKPELVIVDEPIGSASSPLTALPGCNPLWIGTGPKPTCDPEPATPGFVDAESTLPSGWTDLGCTAEGTTGRALSSASTTSPIMTRPFCANFCANLGYPYAGVESADECYCVSVVILRFIKW
ncbi:hypothetical protein EW026_g1367 [Hermanssonia centrifuga]|uniref:WSC domain-containing protein n=1 Tax=Hermanssonia centrifuga TaxID=98765 RepID=A0A4S4KTE0_9APHY|nr:hypothetical protein EW026_g1367 [Hermanssonia centrifuga]